VIDVMDKTIVTPFSDSQYSKLIWTAVEDDKKLSHEAEGWGRYVVTGGKQISTSSRKQQ